jgi:hypothetical protein
MQSVLGRVFKTLHARKRALGMRMGDVKSSVTLNPMTPAELGPPLTQALLSCLSLGGWFPWEDQLLGGEPEAGGRSGCGGEGQLLGCNYLACAAGKVGECPRLEGVQVFAEMPDRLFVLVNPGEL